MKQHVDVVRYTCDNCGRVVYSRDDGSDEHIPDQGYFGTVNIVVPSGSVGAEWYACRRACIRSAVMTVLDRP